MAYSKSNNSKYVRALQFEIFPNEEQKLLIEKTFGCCRKVYNLIIADKLAYYEKYNIDKDFTPAPYKKIYPYLKEPDSTAFANVQQHANRAFAQWIKDKENKSKKNSKSPITPVFIKMSA